LDVCGGSAPFSRTGFWTQLCTDWACVDPAELTTQDMAGADLALSAYLRHTPKDISVHTNRTDWSFRSIVLIPSHEPPGEDDSRVADHENAPMSHSASPSRQY